MDEVTLTFDVISNKTVGVKGFKSVNVKTTGHEKTRYPTVLLYCVDKTKLRRLLILKITLAKHKIPNGIFVRVNPKGRMDEEGVKLWLNKVWSRYSGVLLKNCLFLCGTGFVPIKNE